MRLSIPDLKASLSFLNELYDHVTTAIFLADAEPRLAHFNDTFRAIFRKPEEALLGELCGNAIGCRFVVDEGLDCGKTSNCSRCELRAAIVEALESRGAVYDRSLERDFLIGEERVRKVLRFSASYHEYGGEGYVLVLADDVTRLVETAEALEERARSLEAALGRLSSELGECGRSLAQARASEATLTAELKHRIGNTLQTVYALLQLGEGCRDDGASSDDVLADLAVRLEAVFEAYKSTTYAATGPVVDTGAFVSSLMARIGAGGSRLGQRLLGNRLAMPPIPPIRSDDAVVVGLAVVELCALARGQGFLACVEASAEGRGFAIAASGPCFYEDEDREPRLRLARSLLGQLEGDIAIDSPERAVVYLGRP